MKQFLLTMILAGAAFGQQNVSKLIQLKYVGPDGVMPIVATFGRGNVIANQEPRGRYLTLSGPAEVVASIEEAIKRIDVPPPPVRNVESTFHILLAGPVADGPAPPKELDGVVQQLRGVFGFKGFRLLETVVVRARDGVETNGMMPSPAKGDAPARYTLRYSKALLNGDEKSPRIAMNNLRLDIQIPLSSDSNRYSEALLLTDVDIREGQRVVVGKTSIDAQSQSIFLVVTAKVVD